MEPDIEGEEDELGEMEGEDDGNGDSVGEGDGVGVGGGAVRSFHTKSCPLYPPASLRRAVHAVMPVREIGRRKGVLGGAWEDKVADLEGADRTIL